MSVLFKNEASWRDEGLGALTSSFLPDFFMFFLSFSPAAQKGSDNAAKQSTNKVVTAAKALNELQALITRTANQAGKQLPASSTTVPHSSFHATLSSSQHSNGHGGGGGSSLSHHHHAAGGLSGEYGRAGEGGGAGGAAQGAGAGKRPTYVEPVPAELVQPAAWQPKNTLVRDALR
jgi:hypothetical protein